MKVPKTDVLEQILDKINTELDLDRRGSQQIAMSGAINRLTLQLNDMNKETEFQNNKNQREVLYIKRLLIIFVIKTFLYFLVGVLIAVTENTYNIGIYYYFFLAVFTGVILLVMNRLLNYLSNLVLIYTIISVSCYSIYTTSGEVLHPTGLFFVATMVACLNHSFVYPTILINMVGIFFQIFFQSMQRGKDV